MAVLMQWESGVLHGFRSSRVEAWSVLQALYSVIILPLISNAEL